MDENQDYKESLNRSKVLGDIISNRLVSLMSHDEDLDGITIEDLFINKMEASLSERCERFEIQRGMNNYEIDLFLETVDIMIATRLYTGVLLNPGCDDDNLLNIIDMIYEKGKEKDWRTSALDLAMLSAIGFLPSTIVKKESLIEVCSGIDYN